MKLKSIVSIAFATALMSFLFVSAAGAMTLDFFCISNNSATNCATGEAQLSVEVTDLGGGQVQFDFTNAVGDASSITDVYFDDGTLLGIASVVSTAGVSFAQNAAPPDLPSGENVTPEFETTAGFSLDSNAPMVPENGVDAAGEVLGVIFNLAGGGTYQDIVDELTNGDLRIGIHVQAFGDGGSESFVNLPIPEPGTALLMGVGLIVMARSQRR